MIIIIRRQQRHYRSCIFISLFFLYPLTGLTDQSIALEKYEMRSQQRHE